MKKIKVIQPEKKEDQIPLEILATHIRDVAELGRKINNSKLSRRAICVLMHDATGLSMTIVSQVLDALPQLEKKYLK